MEAIFIALYVTSVSQISDAASTAHNESLTFVMNQNLPISFVFFDIVFCRKGGIHLTQTFDS